MKLKLKEDPKEWRKSALFGALGLGVLSCVLRWRGVVRFGPWLGALLLLGFAALLATLRPHWFRGYYRFMSRIGFYVTQAIGRALLTVLFLFLLTPLGLVLRVLGKDPLRLNRPRQAGSYWTDSKESSPLDRLF